MEHTNTVEIDNQNVVVVGESAEGEWTAPPAQNELPVSVEDYIRNVREACKLDLPNISQQAEHDAVMVMVCGGPTAKTYLAEIREKSKDPKYHVFLLQQDARLAH